MTAAAALSNAPAKFIQELTALGTAGGQYVEQGLSELISKSDPNLAANPGVLSAIWKFIAELDPQWRMAAFTALGTFIQHSRAPLLLRTVLGNAAFAVPEGFDRLLQRNDLTAEKLAKAVKAKVKQAENTIGAEVAYCSNDVRGQIHLASVHPFPPGHDPLAYVNGNLIMVANHCYPRQNLCPACFPFGSATPLPTATPVVVPVEIDPDPLEGLAKFKSPLKARWVKDLYVAILAETRGDPAQGLKGRARPLAKSLADAVAEKPELVEANVPTTLPDVGPPNDLAAMPGVQAFLAAIEMRDHYLRPTTAPEVKDALNEFLQGVPGFLRPIATRLHGWGNDLMLTRFIQALLGTGCLLALFALAFLVVLLAGFAWLGLAFITTAFGIYWPSSLLIGVGLLGVIIWRFLMPIMDMPLNASSGIIDFLDPTDGTGMIGGTVRGIVDWFNTSNRVKPPPEDRESSTYFADRAVSVAVVWSIVSGVGFILAMLIDPASSPPAMALVLAGASAIYFASDTFRKGWRKVGKHDENRYVPATWRIVVLRTSVISGTTLGTVLIVCGFLLAVTVGFSGSARMLITAQTLGERAVVQFASANDVDLDMSDSECEVALAKLSYDLPKLPNVRGGTGQTMAEYCELTENDFPCNCP